MPIKGDKTCASNCQAFALIYGEALPDTGLHATQFLGAAAELVTLDRSVFAKALQPALLVWVEDSLAVVLVFIHTPAIRGRDALVSTEDKSTITLAAFFTSFIASNRGGEARTGGRTASATQIVVAVQGANSILGRNSRLL